MKLPSELWPLVWARVSNATWPPKSSEQADRLFHVANEQSLLPLLMLAEVLPPALVAAKSRHRVWNAIYRKRDELSRAALPILADIIGADAFICYKGADFRHRLYSNPALRPMSDMDMLVPADRFAEVLDRLAARGYPRRRAAHGTPFSPTYPEASILIGDVHIELHSAFVQPMRNTIDYGGLFSRREPFVVGDMTLRRFARSDAIVAQAFELAMDEFNNKLVRHVDFHLLIDGHDHLLPQCVSLAKQWQVQRALFGALDWHRRLFPSATSSAVAAAIDDLLTPQLRDRLRAGPLSSIDRPLTRMGQIQRKLQLVDSPWRRTLLPLAAAWQELEGMVYERAARRAGLVIPPRRKRTIRLRTDSIANPFAR